MFRREIEMVDVRPKMMAIEDMKTNWNGKMKVNMEVKVDKKITINLKWGKWRWEKRSVGVMPPLYEKCRHWKPTKNRNRDQKTEIGFWKGRFWFSSQPHEFVKTKTSDYKSRFWFWFRSGFWSVFDVDNFLLVEVAWTNSTKTEYKGTNSV